jgi:glycosyltransferase 2 family protein
MRSGSRRVVVTILVVVALCVIVYRSRGILRLEDFSWARLVRALAETRISFLIVSVALSYVAYVLRALRWQRFCRTLGRTSLVNILNAILMGFTAMFALGRAGEPIPPLLQARKNRLRVSSMFGLYVIERLFDLAGIAVLAAFGLMYLPATVALRGSGQAWEAKIRATGGVLLLGFAGVVAVVVYFRLHGAGVLERYLTIWHNANGWRRRIAAQFAGFSDGLQAIRTFADLLVTVSYTAVHWALFTLIFLLIMRGFGGLLAGIGLAGAMLILSVTMIGSTLQLPGVGGGAQVATFVILTRMFGVQQEPAAAAAIILWLVTFATACIGGVPLLIREGWSVGDLRRLARAEAAAEEAGTHITEISGGTT